jgi:RHS repeat-associated protein
VDYQYDQAGRLLSRIMSSGARSVYGYDANGWLNTLTHYDAAGATVVSSTYTRDRVGNVLTQVDTGGANAGTSTYVMDALYRLKTADYPGSVNDEAFDYDKVGNRKQHTKGALVANASTRHYLYTAGTNRLAEVRIGTTTGTLDSGFVQDFEGRLLSQSGVGAKLLTWDAKGRVKTLQQGTVIETYAYDPQNHRIGRSRATLGNLDYYLEGEHLESVHSGSVVQEKYFRSSSVDELVAGYQFEGGKLKPFLFHHDGLTSTVALTGHNGGTTQSTSFGAFGTVLGTAGSSANRLKYTGREDDGTGLYYYRARYYDPKIGRFISEDPVGFGAGDVNFYAYVGNNPVNGNDLTGNYAVIDDAIFGVGGALLGLAIQGTFDLSRGKMSPGQEYVGAAFGGAAGGLGALYSPFITPVGAGVAAGVVGNVAKQTACAITDANYNWNYGSTFFDGVVAERLAW